MAIDRAAVRRRVKTITGWTAGGAAALTAAFAFGAARGGHAAQTTARTPSSVRQQSFGDDGSQSYSFAPPTASSAPPVAISGGS